MDAIMHLSIISFQKQIEKTLSVKCLVVYLKPVRVGQPLSLRGTVLKQGRSFAFMKAEIHDVATGELLAFGKQTISLR